MNPAWTTMTRIASGRPFADLLLSKWTIAAAVAASTHVDFVWSVIGRV